MPTLFLLWLMHRSTDDKKPSTKPAPAPDSEKSELVMLFELLIVAALMVVVIALFIFLFYLFITALGQAEVNETGTAVTIDIDVSPFFDTVNNWLPILMALFAIPLGVSIAHQVVRLIGHSMRLAMETPPSSKKKSYEDEMSHAYDHKPAPAIVQQLPPKSGLSLSELMQDGEIPDSYLGGEQ